MSLAARACTFALLPLACSSDPDAANPGPPCGAPFTPGDEAGHPDPFGAAAAGQARAGRWLEESLIVQPGHGQMPIEAGDYVLANERVAVTIEAPGLSDGYNRFGGDIIAADRIGEDGTPLGVSFYGESLIALSNEVLDATSVSVVADGSDGGAAIVRAIGLLRQVPFLAGGLASFYPNQYGLEAAVDYVLEPGSSVLKIRLGLRNPGETSYDVSLGGTPITDQGFGFFHGSKTQLVTGESGFDRPASFADFAGYVNERASFALRPAAGQRLAYAISVSGYDHFSGPGFTVGACSTGFRDHAELVIGEPEYDGLREALRRADGLEPGRAVSGRVSDASGAPIAQAYVHVLDAEARYYARARTDADGEFTIHARPDEAVLLVPQAPGYGVGEGSAVAADESEVELTFPAAATIAVSARDADSNAALPVRIQIIPEAPPPATPAEYGVFDEREGRLHQAYATSGEAELVVPPGRHRVIVSRGFEWELFDTTVEVEAGDTAELTAVLQRSVDTEGYLCADFHLHTNQSVDATDPVALKVQGAIADGLDIVVSSEHEWVVDFGPVVSELGLEAWAFGMPSEELTTFEWGHFGVVPLLPRPGAINNGAVEWVGSLPPAILSGLRELPENPVVVVNHPTWSSFLGYFSAAEFDRASGAGSSELWTDEFDAIEVFNGSDFEANRDGSVADWFALLRHGATFWATGASDSHELRNSPAGYPRTCLYFGHDDPERLTVESVRDALASGASTVSGGLFLKVAGPGGERPGETIRTGSSALEFTVEVEAPSFVDATELEVIVDGETVATEPLVATGSGPGQRFASLVPVPIGDEARSFVVFHARGESDLAPLHPGLRPFAVSNPIFVERE